ncbi:SET and MYND domain-containing protein 4-like [Anopheles moucheti]|uniref:SET and MYND domain-containing protein 4-like n=1 Tax=Anopheles moucheti TaxID=186751 RepID=UPI0022F0E7F8|nr:SET and MYND domain-containing protein 4-like [Anopheles moucheti]
MSRTYNPNQRTAVELFDELWETTIKSSIIPEGKRQLANDELVEFIIGKIKSFMHHFPYRSLFHLSADVKNNAKAIALRKKGNDFFHPTRFENYFLVLTYYNESIVCAEKYSEERAIAYANRSLVCLQLERYADCLENIRLARESNCPERLVEKLNRREAMAKEGLLKPNSATVIPGEQAEELKLSYNCHPKIPQMVECLEVRRNAEYGRHVVTNRKLKAGDVVIIEKPFATMLHEDFRYLRCANCHDSNLLTLIPCEGCSFTMYCSEECLSKAHQQYHRYECGILHELWQIAGDTRFGMAGLRTVATAIALFDHDLDAMKEHLDRLDESKVNAFTMDWTTATPKDVYNTVHVLSTNQALRSRKELCLHVFIASIIHQLMLERTELGAMCATSAEKTRLLFDLILRHWQVAQVNSISLTSLDSNSFEITLKRHGRALWPLLSMLNHSCVPNVFRIALEDGRCAVIAINPIAAGEQLFDSYDLNANECRRTSARLYCMKRTYHFICRCDACELDLDDYSCLKEEDENISSSLGRIKTISGRYKLIELEFAMKEDRESFEQKLSHQTAFYDGLLGALNQPSETLGQNLTVLQTPTSQILSQPVDCSNHVKGDPNDNTEKV